jgi:8-oxo-dGTP pyrophosphatase MutT (NUDIX family)
MTVLQVGIKALIQNEAGKYLFIRRDPAKYPETDAHWDIPGGRIDPSERLAEALAREISEETGLVLTGAPKLLAAQDIMVSSKDLHVVRLTYTSNASGQINLGDEHLEYAWMSREKALADNLDRHVRELIENNLNDNLALNKKGA